MDQKMAIQYDNHYQHPNTLMFVQNLHYVVLNLNMFLQGDVMLRLKQGVYLDGLLPEGQIGICHDTKINETNVKILVVGDLSKDFEYFYKAIV